MIDKKKLIEEFENRMQDDNMMCPIIKILDVLEIIESQPQIGQWIPVEERLPEDASNVLCWAKSLSRGGDVCFVGLCHNEFWFLPTACDTLSYPNSSRYEVVAWMPLPEPYNPPQPTEWKERMMEHFTKGE